MKPMQLNQKRIIENGIFYTPKAVAIELVAGVQERVSTRTKLRFFDPSAGEGALLRAVENQIGRKHGFHGCDLFHSADFPTRKNWKFTQANFFEYKTETKFDVVVTNPPYIQYGKLSNKTRETLYQQYSTNIPIQRNSDLWLYFILKSISHLKDNGVLAAVIPWSFLEADFAHPFREWLVSKFKSIDVLVLRDRHFETTEKRVLLLWLSGYGHKANSIKIGFSEHVEKEHSYSEITLDAWKSSGLVANVGLETESLLKQAKDTEFQVLSNYASVQIGVVTGANNFFILDQHLAKKHGFGEKATIPILTTTTDLQGLNIPKDLKKVLIQFPCLTKKRNAYIAEGKRREFDQRTHCKRRPQWYQVDQGRVPNAIFTYRVSSVPYMALNPKRVQCTNTLHKVFFNSDVTIDQKRWIVLSILSSVAQLSLEYKGRHYGNGILKIEPSTLKNTLVFIPKNITVPEEQFQTVSKLLGEGKKEEASDLATSIIKKYSVLPNKYWEQVSKTLCQIRLRRK